jgi:hypothetical protein
MSIVTKLGLDKLSVWFDKVTTKSLTHLAAKKLINVKY